MNPSDPTRKTGTTQAVPEDSDAVPVLVEPELSVGKKQWYIDRDIQDIRKELKDGARSFANIRDDQEEQRKNLSSVQRDLEGKLESVRRELEGKDITNRREVETEIATHRREVDNSFETLQDKVNPRVTIWKVIQILVAFVFPTAIAIGGYLTVVNKYPDRVEINEQQDKRDAAFQKLQEKNDAELQKLQDKYDKAEKLIIELRVKAGLPPIP